MIKKSIKITATNENPIITGSIHNLLINSYMVKNLIIILWSIILEIIIFFRVSAAFMTESFFSLY